MATKRVALKPVLITTQHRGVFFGYLQGEPTTEKVTLTSMRNVLYWPVDSRGFVGLAANGPPSGSRVGPAAPEGTLYQVTSVVTCTDEAAKRFEEGPWSR